MKTLQHTATSVDGFLATPEMAAIPAIGVICG
jgi:hypothetical protein